MAIAVTIGGATKTSSTMLNQLSIDYGLGSDWTATFPVRDTVSTAGAYRPALDASVTIADGATTLFHGTVTRVEDKPIAPPHVGTLTVVTARAKSQVVDQIIVNETYAAGQTLEDVVTDLCVTYLTAYSITLDATMATGATLEEQVFKDVTLREVFNHLSAITGWLWRITPSDELQFFSAGTKVTSYSLTAANKQSHGPITWDKTREKYVNSVVLRYGTEMQVQKIFTATGTGSVSAWVLDYQPAVNADGYLLSRGLVTEDGADVTLSPPGGGGSYTWTAATNTLTRAAGNLAAGKVITLYYTAQFPQSVTVENSSEISSNGRFGGIFEAPEIFEKDSATELATGLLRRYLTVPKWVRLSTRQGFVMPGDQITLTFTDRTVSGDHIITNVRATTIAKGTVTYALTCLSGSEAQESWTDRLKDALNTGGANAAGGTISGTAVPNFSGRFDDDVVANTGKDDVTTSFETQLTRYTNSGGYGPALILGRSTAAYRWAIFADANEGATPGTVAKLKFHLPRRGSSIECAFYVQEDGSDNFVLLPGASVGGMYLGDYASLIAGVGGADARIKGIRALDAMFENGLFERSRTTRLGEWITPAFNSGHYTASSGNWTVDSGDVTTLAYTLIGKTMIVAFEIDNTDVSATPTDLRITVPGGFTAAKRTRNWAQVSDAGGAFQSALCAINAGSTIISIYKDSTGATNYTLTTGDNTSVHGQIAFEVQ